MVSCFHFSGPWIRILISVSALYVFVVTFAVCIGGLSAWPSCSTTGARFPKCHVNSQRSASPVIAGQTEINCKVIFLGVAMMSYNYYFFSEAWKTELVSLFIKCAHCCLAVKWCFDFQWNSDYLHYEFIIVLSLQV